MVVCYSDFFVHREVRELALRIASLCFIYSTLKSLLKMVIVNYHMSSTENEYGRKECKKK